VLISQDAAIGSDQVRTVSPDARTIRAVLGRFATGVVVVAVMTPDGPVGMTVNSFSSVSLDPPLILFCVRKESSLRPHIVGAQAFAVNVLRESQQDVSQRFASPGFDRFGVIRPRRGMKGVPLLDGALAVIECTTEQVITAGDHDIIIGRVGAVEAPTAAAQPLIYYSGSYRSLKA
jgi:flavin reductase (DIM6/NTAB) family NADH-FMN oxidoreductase RutF